MQGSLVCYPVLGVQRHESSDSHPWGEGSKIPKKLRTSLMYGPRGRRLFTWNLRRMLIFKVDLHVISIMNNIVTLFLSPSCRGHASSFQCLWASPASITQKSKSDRCRISVHPFHLPCREKEYTMWCLSDTWDWAHLLPVRIEFAEGRRCVTREVGLEHCLGHCVPRDYLLVKSLGGTECLSEVYILQWHWRKR